MNPVAIIAALLTLGFAIFLFVPKAQAATLAGSAGDVPPPKNSFPYFSLFQKYSVMYQVPMRLMVSVVSHESNFNPRAVNSETAADKRLGRDVDSLGLCQILYPDTAQALNPGISRDECFDPDTSLDMGFRTMRAALKRYPPSGDFPEDAVSAYNGGHSLRLPDGTFKNQQYVNLVRKEWEKYADV